MSFESIEWLDENAAPAPSGGTALNKSMGQVAFEATQQYLASNADLKDGYIPEIDREPWEDLPPVYREAWEAGAQAVIAAVQK